MPTRSRPGDSTNPPGPAPGSPISRPRSRSPADVRVRLLGQHGTVRPCLALIVAQARRREALTPGLDRPLIRFEPREPPIRPIGTDAAGKGVDSDPLCRPKSVLLRA